MCSPKYEFSVVIFGMFVYNSNFMVFNYFLTHGIPGEVCLVNCCPPSEDCWVAGRAVDKKKKQENMREDRALGRGTH